MKKYSILLILVGGLQFAQAANLDTSQAIKNGTLAPKTPWAVRIHTAGIGSCTALAISDDYILTAKHCIDGAKPSDVKAYYSDGQDHNTPSKEAKDISSIYTPPAGDVALLYLSFANHLAKYPSLNLNYTPKREQGVLMGYAAGTTLYQATGNIVADASGLDAFNGPAIRVFAPKAVGITELGDSGGPLLVGDQVVGIASTIHTDILGFVADYYASLTPWAQWIRQVTGIGIWKERFMIFNNLPKQITVTQDNNNTLDMTADSTSINILPGQTGEFQLSAPEASNNPQIAWNITFGNQSAKLIYSNSITDNKRTANLELKGATYPYRTSCDNNDCPSIIQSGGYIFINLGPDPI